MSLRLKYLIISNWLLNFTAWMLNGDLNFTMFWSKREFWFIPHNPASFLVFSTSGKDKYHSRSCQKKKWRSSLIGFSLSAHDTIFQLVCMFFSLPPKYIWNLPLQTTRIAHHFTSFTARISLLFFHFHFCLLCQLELIPILCLKN